jgi:hypothetical protein
MLDLSHDLATHCADNDRELLPSASTADEARDMDANRAALGGSYLGAVYAQLFRPHWTDGAGLCDRRG